LKDIKRKTSEQNGITFKKPCGPNGEFQKSEMQLETNDMHKIIKERTDLIQTVKKLPFNSILVNVILTKER
jgi:hypothetical protein